MAEELILIVDDEPNMCRAISRLLRGAGYRPVVVAGGAEALLAVESATPDLILLDYNMPGMDGPEVCGRLRKMDRGAEIPVVMVTARFEMEEVELAMGQGADEYVMKPFDNDDLLKKIEEVLALAAEGRLPCQLKAEMQAEETGEERDLEEA